MAMAREGMVSDPVLGLQREQLPHRRASLAETRHLSDDMRQIGNRLRRAAQATLHPGRASLASNISPIRPARDRSFMIDCRQVAARRSWHHDNTPYNSAIQL